MRVEEQIVVEAPAREVWGVVSDPSCYRRFVSGVTRWDVAGEQETGLGARYEMLLRVGSAEVGGLVEVVEYDEPRDLAWTSITGVDQRGRWRLRERESGRTTVTFRLTYQAPGGLLATLADRLSAPIVSGHLRRSLAALKAEVEGGSVPAEGKGVLRGAVAVGERAAQFAADQAYAARVFQQAGLVRPQRPDRLLQAGFALRRFGPTPAAGYAASAARFPGEPAIIDERGTLTFAEVHRRTNALAHALSDAGLLEGDRVAVMCRNHRGFIETTVALSKLGAHALYMNTAFAGPQLTEVAKREKPAAIVYDQEFAELLEDAGRRRKRFVAWREDDERPADPTIDELIEEGDPAEVVPPSETGRFVILTSGTTGTPKGASRGQPDTVGPAVALLSRMPLRTRETTLIAAPLFHSWGFLHFTLGLLLSSTYVLRRRFDPEATLALAAQHQAAVMPVVPVMMQRILELPEETRRKYDLSSLRVVAVSGSALPGELATRFMDEFGDVVYNLYGSTEVAWAAIATPEDLRAAPGTAGTPPRGTRLAILGDDDRPVPPGETGRIFVANEMMFEGYTGGGSKDVVEGLMATGDVGRLDGRGRLFVEGRDDEMIVSGGENVFPQEVEDLLARHDAVAEAAVIGVEDQKFGQRLKAFIVPGGSGKLSEEDVKSYVKSNLAGFKVPREVEFIGELPRNATGKVLKKELAER